MAKKIKRIGIVYDPLNISASLLVQGGSLTQTHSAELSEFVPDRELTPLVIVPEAFVQDPNGIIPDGQIKFSSVSWYALPQDVADKVSQGTILTDELSQYLITAATAGYSVAEDGTLTVSKNVAYLEPIMLVFVGNYIDGRTGRILRIQANAVMSTTSVAVVATLSLDKPASFVFNPIADEGTRSIQANVAIGSKDPASLGASVRYWWYKVESGAETLITTDDLFYESGQNTSKLVIDPEYVDGMVCLLCKAEYALPGASLPSAPTSGCLTARTAVLRRYPAYDFEHIVHGGVEVPSGATMVKNECVVTVGRQVLENPSEHFSIVWYMKRAVHDADFMVIGYGESISIDASEFADGADVALDVIPFDPLGAMTDDDGYIITDDDDNVITL